MGSKVMEKKAILTVLRCLGALLVFLAGLALAQTTETKSDSPSSSPVTETDATAEPQSPAAATQPFEDYEASEQISEDLSVAFPVDI